MGLDLTDIKITVYRSVAEVSEDIWRKLIAPGNLLMQPEYLSMIERLHNKQLGFYYAVCHCGNQLVGFFYFQESVFEGENLIPYFPATESSNIFQQWFARFLALFKPVVRAIHMPMLNAGNIFMTGEVGCYCIDPTNKEQQYRLQMACADKILEINPSIKAILNADFYSTDAKDTQVYNERKFNTIAVEADNAMDVSEFKSFDDYLNKLASKYRVRTKKILKLSEPIVAHELSLEEVLHYENELVALYKRVADKVDFKLAELNDHFFIEQKRIFPNNYRISGYFLEEKLVGFVSIYLVGDKAEVHYFGINYDILKEYHLYQRMLYDVVKLCIDLGVKMIHFGRTASEVKSTIGAKQFPMFGYLKHRNRWINAIMELFTANLKPREYVLRSPFK
jgi:predicted N-acyltransferase